MGQKPKPSSKAPHIISEDIDKIRDAIEQALGGGDISKVKLTRSRAETRLVLVLKGGLEDTEDRLQKIFKGVVV